MIHRWRDERGYRDEDQCQSEALQDARMSWHRREGLLEASLELEAEEDLSAQYEKSAFVEGRLQPLF
jgi:hypothetical protein